MFLLLATPAVHLLAQAGLIGNTNNGISTDNIWSGDAYINAARFQAASNMVVDTVRAQVGSISGKYKCAIYSGSATLPAGLLGQTVEVVDPAAGWQTFPLIAPVALALTP